MRTCFPPNRHTNRVGTKYGIMLILEAVGTRGDGAQGRYVIMTT